MRDLPPWLITLDRCASTNDWMQAQRKGLDPGSVVWTEHQYAGRGQAGRSWLAVPGVLTCSFLFALPASRLPLLSLMAGSALADCCDDFLRAGQRPERCQIKWPNDVFLCDRKLAGILCESHYQADCQLQQAIIGIGLNLQADVQALTQPPTSLQENKPLTAEEAAHEAASLRQDPVHPPVLSASPHLQELAQTAISLHQVLAVVPDMLTLIDALRRRLMQALTGLDACRGSTLLSPARDYLWRRQLRLSSDGQSFTGLADGIADDGCLRLWDDRGGLRLLRCAHIEAIGPRPVSSPSPTPLEPD